MAEWVAAEEEELSRHARLRGSREADWWQGVVEMAEVESCDGRGCKGSREGSSVPLDFWYGSSGHYAAQEEQNYRAGSPDRLQ